jgi:hypothetical protein
MKARQDVQTLTLQELSQRLVKRPMGGCRPTQRRTGIADEVAPGVSTPSRGPTSKPPATSAQTAGAAVGRHVWLREGC